MARGMTRVFDPAGRMFLKAMWMLKFPNSHSYKIIGKDRLSIDQGSVRLNGGRTRNFEERHFSWHKSENYLQ